MDILGVGIPELLFILLIALLVMGPEDLAKAGRTLGKWLRALVQSDTWQLLKQTSKELQDLPTRLMREAGEDLPETASLNLGTWTQQNIAQPLKETQEAIQNELHQAIAWPPPTEAQPSQPPPPADQRSQEEPPQT